MAETSAIAWTKSTFNPWIGCTRVGPGCDHCYAESQDSRKRWGGVVHWGPGVPRMRTSASNWKGPLKWNRDAPESEFAGRRGFWPVFCASLADVFDNEVPSHWRHELFGLIEQTPNLSWLLVTKRIGNVRGMVPASWLVDGFPANVRLMITVVDQTEADRDIPKLLALPCKNGISYEPALGPVDFVSAANQVCRHEDGYQEADTGAWICRQCEEAEEMDIEWIIVGGESGAKARQFRPEWARDTVRQCKAAGVPVFVKQMGANVIIRNDKACGCEDSDCWPNRPDGCDPELEHEPHGFQEGHQGADCRIRLADRAGADPAEWPEVLRVQEFPV